MRTLIVRNAVLVGSVGVRSRASGFRAVAHGPVPTGAMEQEARCVMVQITLAVGRARRIHCWPGGASSCTGSSSRRPLTHKRR